MCRDNWFVLECKQVIVVDQWLWVDYDVVISLGKGWFQINRYNVFILEHVTDMCEQLQGNMLGNSWQGNNGFAYITNSWLMWQYIVKLDYSKIKGKRKELGENFFGYV